jgi:signal transduction histidine kinase
VSILLLCLTSNLSGGISAFVVAVCFLSSIYMNAKGYALFAKIFTIQFADIMILLMSCIYSHHTFLQVGYFPTITSACFLFPYEERKWLYICVLSTLGFYILEATELHKILPSYDLGRDVPTSNLILLAGNILVIILDVFAFIHITRQREDQLLGKQQVILDTQRLLQVQNEDLKTFSIAASHSLQTPLHILKYFLNKFKADHHMSEEGSPADEQIELIEISLMQMDQLVAGLFSYNRILHIDAEYSFFNMIDELEEIKKRMEAKFAHCRISIPRRPVRVRTNRMLFSIIIQNLVDNGLKYNRSETALISIALEQTEKLTSAMVFDNGVGIEEAYFETIFEPFKRVNTSDGIYGNGLGLSGAKRAAERIGGRLFCKGSSNAGSIFQLDLPG